MGPRRRRAKLALTARARVAYFGRIRYLCFGSARDWGYCFFRGWHRTRLKPLPFRAAASSFPVHRRASVLLAGGAAAGLRPLSSSTLVKGIPTTTFDSRGEGYIPISNQILQCEDVLSSSRNQEIQPHIAVSPFLFRVQTI